TAVCGFVGSRQLATEGVGKDGDGRRVSGPDGTDACPWPRPGRHRPRRRQFQCADVVQRAFIARQGGRTRPSGRSSPNCCALFIPLWPDRPSSAYSLDAMSIRIGGTMRPTVVFDFDGTVALGRGPLEAYATCLGELTDGEMLTACRTAVERFDAGETNYRDGYDAIQTTARGRGATDDQLSTAYLRSRQLLATDAAEIHPPAGLAEFMTELTTHASCILATNAPDLGIDRALTVLKLTESLTAVHCSVGKPAGLEPIIATALADGPALAV